MTRTVIGEHNRIHPRGRGDVLLRHLGAAAKIPMLAVKPVKRRDTITSIRLEAQHALPGILAWVTQAEILVFVAVCTLVALGADALVVDEVIDARGPVVAGIRRARVLVFTPIQRELDALVLTRECYLKTIIILIIISIIIMSSS